MSYKKDFENWCLEKKNTHNENRNPSFGEREIWWCKMGVNVGHEIDGKDEFQRPVLIVSKISGNTFLELPLTKKPKGLVEERGIDKFYYKLKEIEKNDKVYDSLVVLSQIRSLDRKRLIDKVGKINDVVFVEIKSKLISIL